MASPLAHGMVGLAVTAWAWLPSGIRSRDLVSEVLRRPGLWVAGILLASLPDLDYLPGILAGDLNAYHHLATHSILWIATTGSGLLLLAWAITNRISLRVILWVMTLLASHLVIDMLTVDGRPPLGIPLVWPWSGESFQFPVLIFEGFQKKNWYDIWQWANLHVLGVELLWTLPVLVATLTIKTCNRKGELT
ncbi:MAG: metal-dependent hydrolase [Verrucomicrobia bacterium]|nr:metal-dependent hydrolase [Verrucomicrobiota bacterium]